MNNKHPKSKFSLIFKQDAVKLVREKGYSCQQAADGHGVSLSALRRWVRTEKEALSPTGPGQASLSLAEREELVRLRKERTNLLMEREILKKAAVFFARESA